MHFVTKKIGPTLLGFAFLLFIVLQAVDFFSFNRSFYALIYDELGTAERIGISRDDLERATDVLLDYIRDDRDDLELTVAISDDELMPMFNEREILHMVDVKELYANAMIVKWVCLTLVLALGVIYLLRFSPRDAVQLIHRGYVRALVVFGTLVLGIAIFVWTDFNRFWNYFHHIFFRNDLWILNPATDRMILMVPSEFFYGLVVRIVGASVITMVLTLILFVFWRKVLNRSSES